MKKRLVVVAALAFLVIPADTALADDLSVRPFGWKGRESASAVNDPSLTVEDKVTLAQPH